MASNLIDSVKDLFTPDLVSQTASSLGESENAVQKALSGAIPASFVGILNKVGSGGASGILDMSKQAASTGVLGNLRGLLGGGGLANILSMASGLFGDKLGSVVRTIAGFAGIRESSASSLMSIAAPAALAAVGREATTDNMGPSRLVSLLNSQKDSILNAVPSGLNIAGALGLGSLSDIGNKLSGALSSIAGGARSTTAYAGETVERTAKRGTNWFLPLLLIVALALAAWWLLGKSCNKEADTATTTADTVRNTPVTEPTITTTRETYMVKLPDGSELNAYRGGIEDRLVTFLGTDWRSLSDDSLKNTWFDFDNLNFETGSATLTSESMKQVNNIVAIMKAFPTAKFKVGGYTDKVGDEAANKNLSQQRADAVAAALKTAGAEAARITGAEGYGEQYARVAESASDEERKTDRRIALSVRK